MSGALSREQYLASLSAESATFTASVVRAGLDAAVPGCPEWTVSDLVWHLTEVHYFWSWMVEGERTSPEGYVPPDRPTDGAALVGLYEATAKHLLDVLGGVDPDRPVWSWANDHSAGFVQRRMPHETAVHRVDADAAAGVPAQMDPALASDGIDEFLEHFLAGDTDAIAMVAGSVHLHCIDVAGEWTVRPTASGWDLTREHAKGDCALRGPAADLLMVLWHRAPLASIDVVGDADVAVRFLAASRRS